MLEALRRTVAERAAEAGLGMRRRIDFVVAVNEVASNSLKHGGGRGVMRLWHDARRLVCEVRDRGRIDDPLADRRLPEPDATHGRGLWMANQLCDLVQIRALADGTIVRLHVRTA
jgi:anti-sigma regulatory factor (Ser/Thr protein kinase)